MIPPLNKRGDRTGRPKLDRPYCFEAKSVWKANVRRAGDKKTYVGSYPTQEAAIAAANYFIETGRKPDNGMFGGATKRGPKGRRDGLPAKQRKPKEINITPKVAKPKPTPTPDPNNAAPKMSYRDRIAMMRGMLARIG